MNLSITTIHKIACAHWLNGLREGHKCARLHGHNYVIELTLARDDKVLVDEVGMIMDSETVRIIVAPILAKLDHRCLNTLGDDDGTAIQFEPMRSQPTAENIAAWLWNRLGLLSKNGTALVRLRVWENDHLFAEVTA